MIPRGQPATGYAPLYSSFVPQGTPKAPRPFQPTAHSPAFQPDYAPVYASSLVPDLASKLPAKLPAVRNPGDQAFQPCSSDDMDMGYAIDLALARPLLSRCATVMGRTLMEADVKSPQDKRKKLLVFFSDIPPPVVSGERSAAGLKFPEQLRVAPSYKALICRLTDPGIMPADIWMLARSKQNVDFCLDIIMPVMGQVMMRLDEIVRRSANSPLSSMNPMIMVGKDWDAPRGKHLASIRNQWIEAARRIWNQDNRSVWRQLNEVPQGSDMIAYVKKSAAEVEIARLQNMMAGKSHNQLPKDGKAKKIQNKSQIPTEFPPVFPPMITTDPVACGIRATPVPRGIAAALRTVVPDHIEQPPAHPYAQQSYQHDQQSYQYSHQPYHEAQPVPPQPHQYAPQPSHYAPTTRKTLLPLPPPPPPPPVVTLAQEAPPPAIEERPPIQTTSYNNYYQSSSNYAPPPPERPRMFFTQQPSTSSSYTAPLSRPPPFFVCRCAASRTHGFFTQKRSVCVCEDNPDRPVDKKPAPTDFDIHQVEWTQDTSSSSIAPPPVPPQLEPPQLIKVPIDTNRPLPKALQAPDFALVARNSHRLASNGHEVTGLSAFSQKTVEWSQNAPSSSTAPVSTRRTLLPNPIQVPMANNTAPVVSKPTQPAPISTTAEARKTAGTEVKPMLRVVPVKAAEAPVEDDGDEGWDEAIVDELFGPSGDVRPPAEDIFGEPAPWHAARLNVTAPEVKPSPLNKSNPKGMLWF